MSPMKKIAAFATLVVGSALFVGCGGAGGPEDQEDLRESAADYYVSVLGDDDNPGTEEAPFEHIGKALAVAAPGQRIQVMPGTYRLEQFPLQVPAGVELLGDLESGGAQVKILGSARISPVSTFAASVTLGEGSRIAGFEIENPIDLGVSTGDCAVVVLGASAVVERCRLVNSECGIFVAEGTDQILRENVFTGNLFGLMFDNAGSNARVEQNTIANNTAVGVNVRRALPDLGGGAAGSVGENRIGLNGIWDLVFDSVGTLKAQDNYWTDTQRDPVGNGLINEAGTGTVDASGAKIMSSLGGP